MAATCLGHECAERQYRANNKKGLVTNRKGAKCPNANPQTDADKKKLQDFDDAAIKTVTDQLDQQATDAAESVDCPTGCKCDKPAWGNTWTVLQSGAIYTATVPDFDCTATVQVTYDWEYRERSSKCFKPAPTSAGLSGQ